MNNPKICIEFAKWILENKFEEFGKYKKSIEELFKEFKSNKNERETRI